MAIALPVLDFGNCIAGDALAGFKVRELEGIVGGCYLPGAFGTGIAGGSK